MSSRALQRRWTIIDPLTPEVAQSMPFDFPVWKDADGNWWGERLGSTTWLKRTSEIRLIRDLAHEERMAELGHPQYLDGRLPFVARSGLSGWWGRPL